MKKPLPNPEALYQSWKADPSPRNLNALLGGCRPGILKACRSVFRDDDAAAEDAAQEALLRLLDPGLSYYTGQGSFRNYAHRIAFHVAVSIKRRVGLPIGEELLSDVLERDPPEPTMEDVLVQEVDAEAVRAAFRILWRTAPQYAQPLEWVLYDDLTIFEIAKKLGVSAVNVRMRTMRGRRRMARFLREAGYPVPEVDRVPEDES